MTKFTIALREIGTYKEVLRSQVHIMSSRYTYSFYEMCVELVVGRCLRLWVRKCSRHDGFFVVQCGSSMTIV